MSVIVAVCNRYWSTLACFGAIKTAQAGADFEVIVIDDCSSDKTSRILSGVPGLVTLRNDKRLGLSGSFNIGAGAAKGEYLVCLDQDTLVSKGWLGSLAQTFRDFPDAGLAGAKLVRPDGRLKEAGASLWRDASAWAYGESDDAGHPWYNFAREVDYCTGGFMVPRALFLDLGGFDVNQSDAFADADLAFRIRLSGHKVIYQSVATIVQQHGPTRESEPHPEDRNKLRPISSDFAIAMATGFKHTPIQARGSSGWFGRTVKSKRRSGRCSVIDHRIPSPDRDSGSLRMMEIIRGIKRRGHHVTLVPDNMAVFSPYLENLESEGVEVIHRPYYDSVEEYLAQHGREQNLVIISRADVASRHMALVRAPRSAGSNHLRHGRPSLHARGSASAAWRLLEDTRTGQEPQGGRAWSGTDGRSHAGGLARRENDHRSGMRSPDRRANPVKYSSGTGKRAARVRIAAQHHLYRWLRSCPEC